MPLSRGKLAIIHVAKRQLGLDEDTYRTILLKIGGVSSSKDLTPSAFDAVMGYFEYIGFAPRHAAGPFYGKRPGMATPMQVQYIRDMWVRWKGTPDWAALDAWIKRTFKVSSLRFADEPCARKIIYALRKMTARPSGGESRKKASR